MNLKGESGEISDGNEGHVTRNWRKDEPYYKAEKNFAELCSSILWKVEIVSNKIGYLGEEISKWSIEGVAWLVPSNSHSIMWKKRERLKKELLSKKEPELEDLGNYQPTHIVKK